MYTCRWLSLLFVAAVALCYRHFYPRKVMMRRRSRSLAATRGITQNRMTAPFLISTKDGERSIAYNLNHWMGLTIDGGGHYDDHGHVHTATIGPQFKLRRNTSLPSRRFWLAPRRFRRTARPTRPRSL